MKLLSMRKISLMSLLDNLVNLQKMLQKEHGVRCIPML